MSDYVDTTEMQCALDGCDHVYGEDESPPCPECGGTLIAFVTSAPPVPLADEPFPDPSTILTDHPDPEDAPDG